MEKQSSKIWGKLKKVFFWGDPSAQEKKKNREWAKFVMKCSGFVLIICSLFYFFAPGFKTVVFLKFIGGVAVFFLISLFLWIFGLETPES